MIPILTAQDLYGISSPCKGCKDRKYDCHFKGNCKKYDEYRELIDKFKESDGYKEFIKNESIERKLKDV